ncbi:DUF2938 domain-containing protein [Methyloversatilis universalis]|uniref:DUF2938 domain-containing protein n=1 Tax=Methyloversatilis universalis TaxID=378211 RepID=UPI00037B9C87|nr:DUF2938 domain-containing protein [Methyloversatilis universalis]
MLSFNDLGRVMFIGVGATAVMDAWLLTLDRTGQPFSGFGLIGRWIGHMARGRFVHASIARAERLRGESALGWATHYAVGVIYAGLLVLTPGLHWLERPALWPALVFGLLTVVAPFCLMQPAMGAGFAAARTPRPGANRLRSLGNHIVFGAGLYLSALALEGIRS